MDQFVCVRIVQFNAVDLTLFQFDYDLTFAVFFMNADRTIYGRYGSRSSRESDHDLSLQGFHQALVAARSLHNNYPANRQSLGGKQPVEVRYKTPDEYPSLRGKFPARIDYTARDVARSCMHCHQVRDAERLVYRTARQPIPDEVLFPWPMPDVVGLKLDPANAAVVREVVADSAAQRAGFRPGDRIVSLAGQPLVSVADVQWVLHQSVAPAQLRAEVVRESQAEGGSARTERRSLTLELAADWRLKSDISWRVTTWDLRRIATGGLLLERLPAEERQRLGLADNTLALHAKHVGEYGEHAAAKRNGFQRGDVIVELDGRADDLSETELLRLVLRTRRPGDQVPVTVLRGGNRVPLKMPVQ